MQATILSIVNTFGYLGVFLLIAIENIFPPIPSEVILTFGGFATTLKGSNMNIIGVIIAATLGAVLGALILYALGRIFDYDRLCAIFNSKVGRALHLKVKDLDKAKKWFDRYEAKAVFFGRFIPIVRSLVSIPAGMTKMDLKPFLILTTLGTLIWNIVLVYLGKLAGDNWESIASYFDVYSKGMLLTLIVITVVGLIIYKKRLPKKK